MAEANAVGQRAAVRGHGACQVEFDAGGRETLQVTGGDQFAEHHGGRFEGFHLVVAIGAMRLVLDDENAERSAGAQNRHAEEGIVDLLAGLREIFESGVLLGFRQVERTCPRGDRADKALAEAQGGAVDRRRVQADRRVEFQNAVGAQHVGGAHFGDHVLGDLAHDPVEPLLRLHRLRHDLAEPLQEDTWSGIRLT